MVSEHYRSLAEIDGGIRSRVFKGHLRRRFKHRAELAGFSLPYYIVSDLPPPLLQLPAPPLQLPATSQLTTSLKFPSPPPLLQQPATTISAPSSFLQHRTTTVSSSTQPPPTIFHSPLFQQALNHKPSHTLNPISPPKYFPPSDLEEEEKKEEEEKENEEGDEQQQEQQQQQQISDPPSSPDSPSSSSSLSLSAPAPLPPSPPSPPPPPLPDPATPPLQNPPPPLSLQPPTTTVSPSSVESKLRSRVLKEEENGKEEKEKGKEKEKEEKKRAAAGFRSNNRAERKEVNCPIRLAESTQRFGLGRPGLPNPIQALYHLCSSSTGLYNPTLLGPHSTVPAQPVPPEPGPTEAVKEKFFSTFFASSPSSLHQNGSDFKLPMEIQWLLGLVDDEEDKRYNKGVYNLEDLEPFSFFRLIFDVH